MPEAGGANEPIRLSKRVMALVPCSRADAERYIEGGWVTVDGAVVQEPQARVRNETVLLDAHASLEPTPPVTLLMHKLPGELRWPAPEWHAAEDKSGVRILKKHFLNLKAFLPLPPQASGLVVFTQDGRIARKLEEDAETIEQECIVEVAGSIAEGGLAKLCHGLSFNGRPNPPIKVSWQNETRLRFALKGIRPGQVPSMCEAVGLRVVAMKRIRIGRVPMAQLPPGQWRYLGAHERF